MAGLEVAQTTLDNGLRVVVVPLAHLHTATVAVLGKAGPRYESPATNGLSHLVEHMLFRGTPTHPTSFALNRAVEELGGTLEGETHVDQTVYRVALPPGGVRPVLGLLGEMFRAPVMEGLDVEKRVIREEILEGLDEDGQPIDIDEIARAQAFAGHPLGLSLTGSLEAIDAFREEDLREHVTAHYGARNLTLAVAGAVDPGAVLDAAGRGFGALPPGVPVTPRPPGPTGGPFFRYVESSGSQTDVRLTFRVPGERHPDALALQVLARILDDGLSSRLHHAVSDVHGLAYEAFCAVELYEDAGLFELGAAVEHGKTPAVLGVLQGLVRELVATPVPPGELDRARRRYGWALDAAIDDADAVADLYGERALFGLPDDLATLRRRVPALDADALQGAATRHLVPDHMRITAVGLLDPALQEAARRAARGV